MFRCFALKDQGEIYAGSPTVLYPRSLQVRRSPPVIKTPSDRKMIQYKNFEEIEVACVAYGQPSPKVSWEINGVTIESGTSKRNRVYLTLICSKYSSFLI